LLGFSAIICEGVDRKLYALLKPVFEIAKIRTLSLPKGLLEIVFSPLHPFGRLRDRDSFSFQQSKSLTEYCEDIFLTTGVVSGWSGRAGP
jgi:hypothetical protein